MYCGCGLSFLCVNFVFFKIHFNIMNFLDPRSSAVIETETLWSGTLLCLPSELDICVFTRSPGTDTCL